MKFYKYISVLFHPIVIPTIGVLTYFMLIQNNLNSQQRLAVLGLIFVTTYAIPLVILILFKKLNLIKSFDAKTIKERKIPVAIMIVLFYLLGNTLLNTSNLKDLGLLFYGTTLGLIGTYISFSFKLKTSLHLLSFGVLTSFFIILSYIYSKNFVVIINIILLFSGVLASARLHLKAHNTKEVYFGFFFGFVSNFIIYYFL